MSLRVCVHIYTHKDTHDTYMHTQTCTHAHTHTHTHAHTHTYIHTHTHVHACIYIYIHTHIHFYMYVHMYIHILMHIHMYTFIYIHRHTLSLSHTHTLTHAHTPWYTHMQTYTHDIYTEGGVGKVKGGGTGAIWLSRVNCKGTEHDIGDCPQRCGGDQCTHANDVGVCCSGFRLGVVGKRKNRRRSFTTIRSLQAHCYHPDKCQPALDHQGRHCQQVSLLLNWLDTIAIEQSLGCQDKPHKNETQHDKTQRKTT